jgi:hypothetical protein
MLRLRTPICFLIDGSGVIRDVTANPVCLYRPDPADVLDIVKNFESQDGSNQSCL